MNVAQLTTIESILDETRPPSSDDYHEWGELAARRAAEMPEIVYAVLREAMVARARKRLTVEAGRTVNGIATAIADARTGQSTIWRLSTDARWLRERGQALVAEGRTKVALGQLMQQAADCIDAHPGLDARAAWVAQGLDPAELDAASDAAA